MKLSKALYFEDISRRNTCPAYAYAEATAEGTVRRRSKIASGNLESEPMANPWAADAELWEAMLVKCVLWVKVQTTGQIVA